MFNLCHHWNDCRYKLHISPLFSIAGRPTACEIEQPSPLFFFSTKLIKEIFRQIPFLFPAVEAQVSVDSDLTWLREIMDTQTKSHLMVFNLSHPFSEFAREQLHHQILEFNVGTTVCQLEDILQFSSAVHSWVRVASAVVVSVNYHLRT